MKPNSGPTAWAWEILDQRGRWVLCHWAEPYRRVLLKKAEIEGKPSLEARPVCVRLVRNSKTRS